VVVKYLIPLEVVSLIVDRHRVFRTMALHPQPEGYAEGKEELLAYCYDNDITFPFQDYPFTWVEVTPPSRSPSPNLAEISAHEFEPNLEESPDCTEEIQTDLNNILTLREDSDLVNTRKSEPLDLEVLTPCQTGPDTLRKYGPNSLMKCATLLPKEVLCGEEGMEISKDTNDVVAAIGKDSKLTVTEEEAVFLTEIITRYNHERSVDIIHTKVPIFPSTTNL